MSWRRVDSPRAFFAVAYAMTAAFLMFLLACVAVVVNGKPHAWVGVVAALLFTMASVRVRFMGVYYGEYGVRSRSLLRTRTVPWASVEKFEDRPADHDPWKPGSDEPARAIWIVRWDGEVIQTPMVYLPAEALVGMRLRRNRWRWTRQECQAVFDKLNRELARARRRIVEDADQD